MSTQSPPNTLRIIGGNWRGRKVSFAHQRKIRPTPDRVRETLFNWLQGYLPGARCLELYAGSGILSLEALSRGAIEVVLLDIMQDVTGHLSREFRKFQVPSQQYKLINMSALDWLSQDNSHAFDIIFLDPPFGGDELDLVLHDISGKKLINPDGWIYVESELSLQKDQLPDDWVIHRQKKAGAVHFCLCKSLPRR
jgi:16S rRNA (guanine966-N2)-methyltransferase